MRHRRQTGFSLIELLIVVAVILIIAAIAIPNLVKSKMAANEASAVDSLHTLNTSLQGYASLYGIGFPANLTDMGPSSSPSSTAADFIDEVLASGTKSGYTFSYVPGPALTGGVITTYSITANPVSRGTTGQRGFFTDESLLIRVNATGTASSTDGPI